MLHYNSDLYRIIIDVVEQGISLNPSELPDPSQVPRVEGARRGEGRVGLSQHLRIGVGVLDLVCHSR